MVLEQNSEIVIIQVDSYIYSADKVIIINGKNYKLIAATIGYINSDKLGGHSICGLICDDKFYVYDSNNHIAYTDWFSGDMSGYYKVLPDSYFPDYNLFKINDLFYMLMK